MKCVGSPPKEDVSTPLYRAPGSLPTSNRAGPSAWKPHASPAQRTHSQAASRGRSTGDERREGGREGSCYLLGVPPTGGSWVQGVTCFLTQSLWESEGPREGRGLFSLHIDTVKGQVPQGVSGWMRAGKQASGRGSRAPRSHGAHGGGLVQGEDYHGCIHHSLHDHKQKTRLAASAGHTLTSGSQGRQEGKHDATF